MYVSGKLVEQHDQREATVRRIRPFIQLIIPGLLQQMPKTLLELPVEVRVLFEPARMIDIVEPKSQDFVDSFFPHASLLLRLAGPNCLVWQMRLSGKIRYRRGGSLDKFSVALSRVRIAIIAAFRAAERKTKGSS